LWASQGGHRLDQHLQHVVGPETDLASGQANDAGITRPKHLDPGPAPQSEFCKLMDVIRVAENASDAGAMADRQVF
jgi:hypothetical protein